MEGTAWRFNRYAERAARRRDRAEPTAAERRQTRRRPRRWHDAAAPAPATARAASRRSPGRCSSARSRCSRSAPSTPCWSRAHSALDLAALAVGALGLHHGLRRPDGRGAGDRADRRPAVRRRQAAPSAATQAAPGGVAGARAVGARLRCCCCSRSPSSRCRSAEPDGRRQGARLPRRPRLRAAGRRCCSPPTAASTSPCRGRRR